MRLQRVLTPDCSFSSRVCPTSLTMSKGVFPGGDFPGPRSRQGLTSQCQDSRKIVEDYLWEGVAHIYVDLSASMQCWTHRSLNTSIHNSDCPTCTLFPVDLFLLLFGFHSLVVDLTTWWAGLHFSGDLNLLQHRQLGSCDDTDTMKAVMTITTMMMVVAVMIART